MLHFVQHNNQKIIQLENEKKIKAGISLGDINGIGPEIIIKTFFDQRMLEICTPIVFGSNKIMSSYCRMLEITDFSFHHINKPEEVNPKRANIINVWNEDVQLEVGKSTVSGGKYALRSLEAATAALKNKQVDVLVTAPINKDNIQSETFKFSGHTEYLAQQFDAKQHLMLLVNGNLRIGLVTGHIPLNEVSKAITPAKILDKLKLMQQSLLQDFGIRKPKIALLGTNPHAGDNGLLGKEEKEIIEPAVKQAVESGVLAFGPYPADGFFGSGNWKNFDGILAMYHDQGLIPFKALSFDSGVNFTAGLSVVRTSPDHGTAYDLAGKNKASENSFREAVYLACDIYRERTGYKEISSNPLKFSKLRKDY